MILYLTDVKTRFSAIIPERCPMQESLFGRTYSGTGREVLLGASRRVFGGGTVFEEVAPAAGIFLLANGTVRLTRRTEP